jgi:hypothetical protein
MKIYTGSIGITLTLEEFEDILEKDLLETVIGTVASISTVYEFINSDRKDGMPEEFTILDLLSGGLYDEDDDEEDGCIGCGACGRFDEEDDFYDDYDDDYEEDDNEVIERIYYNLFEGGGITDV